MLFTSSMLESFMTAYLSSFYLIHVSYHDLVSIIINSSMYTSYGAFVFVKVLLSRSVCQLNCLRTSNKLSLGGWYVQNVSTFPKTFAVVWSLTCIIWMQLTRTNDVFSRIALVSSFVQKNQLSGKTPIFIGIIIIHRKTHGTKRGDGVAARGDHNLAGRGQGWARAP